MKKSTIGAMAMGIVIGSSAGTASAQTVANSSDYLEARSIPARTLFFDFNGTGERMPKINWGIDCAWISEANMLQGRNYMNLFNNNISLVRVSFQPTYALNGTSLSNDHLVDLNERLRIVGLLGTTPGVCLNSDPKPINGGGYTVAPMYSNGANATNWVNLMKATGKYVESHGYPVVSVAPFNEPDYGWGHGSKNDLNNICRAARNDSWFNGKRLMTGSTLNCSEAWGWFSATQTYADEGNTHQLAGTFADFKSFFQRVKAAGKVVTEDELHNTMEAMVGANYGLNNGIWWGTAEHTRSQFCRASDGNGYRLAYAEIDDAFMAASVYRNTQDGVTEAFVGASERQAKQSSFGFVSRDRDVYYDGYGPTRAYFVDMPADPNGSYGTALQRNAEGVIKIQSGEDVQPSPVAGTWQIVNVANGKVLTGVGSNTSIGAYNVTLSTSVANDVRQAWKVQHLPHNNGGDFSYEYITLANQNQPATFYLDDLDWSFDEGKQVIIYPGGGSGCEQWWFEYAGNGSYYIHNRYSNLVLDGANGSTVVQRTLTRANSQKWKLADPSIVADRTAPSTPTGLSATGLLAAIKLTWNANNNSDLNGYTILRATYGQNDWNTIARAVKGTTYVDNTAVQGVRYSYKIKAIDKSSNISSASSTVNAITNGSQGLVASYSFDNNTADATANMMGAATNAGYANGHNGKALSFNGSTYALLPYQIGNMQEMTFCSWVRWDGGNAWQRIFDFGNGEDAYFFLTPSNVNGKLTFEIKANGTVQTFNASSALATNTWKHVAVTIRSGRVVVYVDGQAVVSSSNITLRPSDVAGVCNYLGRSQFVVDPMFRGLIDDVRIYNYALSQSEVQSVAGTGGTGSSASPDNPIDVTSYLANPEIVNNANTHTMPSGWSLYGSFGSGNGQYTTSTGNTMLEVWHYTPSRMAFDYYQQVRNLPAGTYRLSCDMLYRGGGSNQVGLYAYVSNPNGEVHQPATNFDGQLHNYTLTFYVNANSFVNLGVKRFATCSGDWFAADNFRLEYLGNTSSARMRLGNDDFTTSVESVDTTNEPDVIGIYTTGGVKLSEMQRGINILRMSDGTTKKVKL
ncbi:MAG: RICIN domain-containing protein [Bacteroidaceae bacterium]|nr:RICIN domain-containing protein [Bacteroidaceae bacterium]